jgi:uracil-DNA glycosylase family 4
MQPKAPYAKCDECPLKARPFCGSYVPSGALLTVVGEAPGTNEIIEGTPFVGQSGIVLRRVLEFSGVDPRQTAMTNAVLCRPIGTDDPPDAAIRACADRLDADIQRSGAKHIVAAGNIAARALDALSGRDVSGGILSRAGKTYDYARMMINNAGAVYDTDTIDIKNQVFKYTCTTNPAYVLRQDAYLPTYLRHIQMAINPRERDFDINAVKYAVMSESNRVRILEYITSFDDGAPMAFDVETGDLQWYDTPARSASPLLCLVLTFEDWRSIIIPADMLQVRAVKDCIEVVLKRYHVITQNGKFDQNVMAAREGIHFDIHDDTMLQHYASYELGGHGLKELASEYLGAPNYEEQTILSWFRANGMGELDKRDYSKLPLERLYKYAAIDGAVTLQLWRIFDVELQAKKLHEWPYSNVLMRLGNALPRVEQEGIGIDRAQLARARGEFEAALNIIEQTMNNLIVPLVARLPDTSAGELKRLMTTMRKISAGVSNGKGGIKRGTAVYEEYMAYNPRSPDQTHHIIYNVLGLKLSKRLIKPTSANTGKEALEALPDHPFIDELRQHRRIAKMIDTYIASIERRATTKDLIHVDFRITGTEIGRLSAASGDHGIPRPDDYYGAMIRSLFTADPNNENEVLVVADISQAELRAYAHIAQVKFLIDKYRNGEDVHKETALMLEKFGAPLFEGFAHNLFIANDPNADPHDRTRAKTFIKARRVLAKNTNFGKIYGGGAAGISGMIGGAISASVMREVLKVYEQIMPETREYAASQYAFLLKHGYVKTIFNRHRRFYVITDMNKDEAAKAAVHMTIAGSAADITNLAMVRLVDKGVRVCHSNHDSLIARAKRDEAAQVGALMVNTMQATGEEFMGSVPWIADLDCDEIDGVKVFTRRWVPVPKREDFDARGKLITL